MHCQGRVEDGDSSTSWFEALFGFQEVDGIKEHLVLEGSRLRSLVNGHSYAVGSFTTPSLAELRGLDRQLGAGAPEKRLHLHHLATGDVFDMLCSPDNRLATFQAASQFNCLEMPNDEVTPEKGITQYAQDGTQGPACALAAAPATVFRNYFLPMPDGREGQTHDNQVNCISDLLTASRLADLVDVNNGYLRTDAERLRTLNSRLASVDRDELLGELRIGLQVGAEVPFSRRYLLVEVPSVVCAICRSGGVVASGSHCP